MEIKEVLEQVGIEGKKADVYLACLEMGGATAYLIAKKTCLKRPTTYDIINQLMKEGLVHKALKGHIKYYSPADPEVLLVKAKERETKIRSIMGGLQNLYNSPKIKPFIKYFEGKEGIKEMAKEKGAWAYIEKPYVLDKIKAVPEVYRTLIPEYVKDYVSLNQFAP